jgi:alpha-L-fucosidase
MTPSSASTNPIPARANEHASLPLVAVAVSLGVAVASGDTPVLPPIPPTPPAREVDIVPMGDAKSASEVHLDLPVSTGPFEPTWESIEKQYPGTPEWLRDAKFGIWVHFGPQSAGESGDWYARKMYRQGELAYSNHLKRYGHPSVAGYKEVLRDWNPSKLDPAKLAQIYKDAGARFLIVQGVHHDNFDLWNSKYQPWNSVRMGPRRDIIAEWAAAARKQGLRYGVAFHHEYTWWWWQTAFGSDETGPLAGVPYDGYQTLADGVGKWWEGLDPRLLYGIDLREYKGVSAAAASPWSPPPPGVFTNHMAYAKWYATRWALRMMDVVDKYDPDFIYTDGTDTQPFSGSGTGTGLKADAMQRVIADFYNHTLKKRGKVDTFSIIKFRPKTNGTVNTYESGMPANIKTDQPWIAEAPVGDWFYRPGFTYDSGMVVRYIIETAARDGNAAVCISLLPDGSLDEGSLNMLKGVGEWMRRNGSSIYGSRAWVQPGEGEMVNGRLKMIPGGALDKHHATTTFGPQDFRFTVGKDGALYAFCLTVPEPGTQLKIKLLALRANLWGHPVEEVTLLGAGGGKLDWRQEDEGLVITCPDTHLFSTALVFRIK